ncbi:type II toxin-antitoxin system RelE/ParE family toxin [Methylobacter sp.]|uniref:type II toxin-antitoxin system RelE family toxin n=1 Tax=Methylobacter sp. TaxID=2051955 RepID=UPI0024896769|nr:type II toxin-antitoxin system RelE/ParE family toxin [Methylobacter sp.]MDI1279382.1 type II toxin-antitoxin system RelE/ParE family toxin [Methylobacter sp.]MDI1359856.1 type II toxin-antitoxin system RelE/ParE family toxin [Methylobacter sp.]
MTYELEFKKSALTEWDKLGHTIKEQFKKKLKKRLENPHAPSAALIGAPNIYKIKLRQVGYRLIYSVEDKVITVTVIAIGKRNRNEVYDLALSRMKE